MALDDVRFGYVMSLDIFFTNLQPLNVQLNYIMVFYELLNHISKRYIIMEQSLIVKSLLLNLLNDRPCKGKNNQQNIPAA